jgi:hypothetical protein
MTVWARSAVMVNIQKQTMGKKIFDISIYLKW